MFTQRLSMDCTEEQYEKYLRDELLKMGYKGGTGYWEQNDVISNNHNSEHGLIGNTYSYNRNTANRTYLGSFNAPLFLALAAMTDKAEGNYGEYVIVLRSGRIYKMDEEDKIPPEHTLIRKATKEEIMEKLGNNKQPMWESCSNIINNLEEIYTAIELLKSNGYKIMRKIETWEEV